MFVENRIELVRPIKLRRELDVWQMMLAYRALAPIKRAALKKYVMALQSDEVFIND